MSDSSSSGSDSDDSSSSSSGSCSSAVPRSSQSSDTDSESSSESEAEHAQVQPQLCSADSVGEDVESEASDDQPPPEPEGVRARSLGTILETTEQHLERHAYPTHIKDCERCRYWHNRQKWEEDATFPNPRTGLPLVWLVEQPDCVRKPWHLGCLVCMKAKAKGPFGRCKAGAKLSNIRRHGTSPCHLAALQTYTAQVCSQQPTSNEPHPTGLTFAHIMFQRTLLKHGGSFESFGDYCKAARLAGAALGFGSVGPQISKQITSCMALRETKLTAKFLAASTTAGIIQDGLGTHLASRIRMVVWKWPKTVSPTEHIAGLERLSAQDSLGPWIIERVAAVGELLADQTSNAKRLLVREAVAKNCLTEEAFHHAQKVLRFFATDAAPDETHAGLEVFQTDFPNLVFQSTDPSHGAMVALKAALKADKECAAVDRLMVSGKQPASLSKLLRTSPKLQSVMKDAELSDCLQILSHFGFAPQRFDSRKIPLGRIAIRVKQAFTVLAHEAENGEKERRAAAAHILHELSGKNTWRLVLGAMIADLCHEHSKFVHTGDLQDVHPLQLEKSESLFLSRLLVLFQEGLIVTKAASATFTGQVLRFLSTSQLLFFKKKALVLSLGELRSDDMLYMPLNRMRLIVHAIRRMLQATRPSFCWGKRFLAFQLPFALVDPTPQQSSQVAAACTSHGQLFCFEPRGLGLRV